MDMPALFACKHGLMPVFGAKKFAACEAFLHDKAGAFWAKSRISV
jgi:hypothetical protein